MNKGTIKRIGFLAGGAVVLALCYYFRIDRYFSWENLKSHDTWLKYMVAHHYALSALIFAITMGLLVTVALPVTGPVALLGGYLFGFVPGIVFTLTGATIGSVLFFLAVRNFFRDSFHKKYGPKIQKFENKIAKDGASFLLILQFMSVIPYFFINVLAALSPVSTTTFIWTTLLGSAPLLSMYTFAGTQFHQISGKSLFSPYMIGIFGLLIILALLPLIIKRFKPNIH